MSLTSSFGTTLEIGTSAANAATDTYKVISEITNIPEFGPVYQEITHQSIDNRVTRKFKGSLNNGSFTIALGNDVANLGQAALIAALDTDVDFNFRVKLADTPLTGASPKPTTILFKAKVTSAPINIGGPNQIVGRSVMIAISDGFTYTAASST